MPILLIRHGETASNATRVVQTPDVPLNERGLAQAERLAQRLATLGVQRLLSSDHTRAAMTAEAISKHCGVPIQWDPGLRERNFGELRGRLYTEIPGDFFGPDYEPPGGETWPQFNERVDQTWERVARSWTDDEGNLVLVTHGLFLRSLVERRVALGEHAPAPRAFRNTSLTLLQAAPPWMVKRLNCCAHLEEQEDLARPGGAV